MFGEKLQELRKQRGLSQEDLAEKLAVSRQAVSKWESNQVYPEIEKLIELRNFFDSSLDELLIEENSKVRVSIIGASEAGRALSVDWNEQNIHQTNRLFWETKGAELLGEISLPFYGAFLSEEKLQLLGDLSGKKVLEIGCGSGRSLAYMGAQAVSELWGMDLSEQQLQRAKEHLTAQGYSAHLFCSPMERETELPKLYFDLVYSIYAIGWTTDLEQTFSHMASYLKKDGIFIFSWSHPIHKSVALEKGQLIFKKSYFDESWYHVSLDGSELTLSDRKLSTYVNALAKAGFIIEQMIEETDTKGIEDRKDRSDFAVKAAMLPVTFVIKAKKL